MTDQNATFDRDAAREVLHEYAAGIRGNETLYPWASDALDALAGCVRPVATIDLGDREDVWQGIHDVLSDHNLPHSRRIIADNILALVAPDSRFDTIRALHVQNAMLNYDDARWCVECNKEWPCATVRALDGNPS